MGAAIISGGCRIAAGGNAPGDRCGASVSSRASRGLPGTFPIQWRGKGTIRGGPPAADRAGSPPAPRAGGGTIRRPPGSGSGPRSRVQTDGSSITWTAPVGARHRQPAPETLLGGSWAKSNLRQRLASWLDLVAPATSRGRSRPIGGAMGRDGVNPAACTPPGSRQAGHAGRGDGARGSADNPARGTAG